MNDCSGIIEFNSIYEVRVFPTYSDSAKKGEAGVLLVSEIVFNEFGWIFRRTPQEYDFGIDGNIDVVMPDGRVSGQQCALQIKNGTSFFKEKNQWGYVYRGESKHIHYLQNYPLPVLIVLCNPDTKECIWVKFDLRSIETTEKGWKVTVPATNKFKDDKDKILSLLPQLEDPTEKIEQYKQFRDVASTSNIIWYQIDYKSILDGDVSGPRELIDRLRATQHVAVEAAGKLEISFDGYDSDERELWEIPEVRKYVKGLVAELPEFLFFVSVSPGSSILATIAWCMTDVEKRRRVGDEVEIIHDIYQIAKFIDDNLESWNELNRWTNRGYDDCKKHYKNILNSTGLLDGLSEREVSDLIEGKEA